MPKAIWNDHVIAESDATVVVEGNHYFPVESVKHEYLMPSETHTRCGWKGECSYYTIVAGAEINRDAAWFYPEPLPAAENIKGKIAFWKGVMVEA